MHDGPLRYILSDPQKNKPLIEEVIPRYLAFHAIKEFMDIDNAKAQARSH